MTLIGYPVLNNSGPEAYAGFSTAASRGILLNAPGSTNTKSGYTEVINSTDYDWGAILVSGRTNNGHTEHFFDVAVGAASSEDIIIPNLYVAGRDLQSLKTWCFPIGVPSGSRIAVRHQANSNQQAVVAINGLPLSQAMMGGFAKVDTYGANTGSTVGVDIDPGASAETKGAYSQITSSTSDDYIGFVLSLGISANTTAANFSNWLIDVAIGAASSEQIILPDLPMRSSAQEVVAFYTGFFPIGIPSGTRIAARAQSNITDATDRVIDMVFHGIR